MELVISGGAALSFYVVGCILTLLSTHFFFQLKRVGPVFPVCLFFSNSCSWGLWLPRKFLRYKQGRAFSNHSPRSLHAHDSVGGFPRCRCGFCSDGCFPVAVMVETEAPMARQPPEATAVIQPTTLLRLPFLMVSWLACHTVLQLSLQRPGDSPVALVDILTLLQGLQLQDFKLKYL